jgi:hypothetical protein
MGIELRRNVVEKTRKLSGSRFWGDDCVAVESHFQIH